MTGWNTVSIVGVGLIGGSFALALRKAGFQGQIAGVSSPEAIEAALSRGAIDHALPLADAAAQSELIYLAQPIERILATIDELDAYVRPGTLITDAGSTKSVIVARAAEKIRRGRFVGGHPMAGKETRGVVYADSDLFQRRPYILTGSDPELESWIQRIGARVIKLDAREHDRLVALSSHVPQLISTALAGCLAAESGASRVAGPAAIDLTRLAMSPYEIWSEIFATNRDPIDAALDTFIAKLQEMREKLRSSGLAEEFAQGRSAARSLRNVDRL